MATAQSSTASSAPVSKRVDFNRTLAFPRWTAAFVADNWHAQKLFRRVHRGWLGPRAFELRNQTLTKCLLPFYIVRMKILAEVTAEVGFTRKQAPAAKDISSMGMTVCESTEHGFWCKTPALAFDLSRFWTDGRVDFAQDDPRVLNMQATGLVFAGSREFVPIMKQSKQVGMSFFSDIEDDDRVVKKIRWEPFAVVDQSRLAADPFLISPEGAEMIYMQKIRKQVEVAARALVLKKFLAEDVRNVVVKLTVTEGFKEVTPVALPFYHNVNKWGGVKIYTLIDALHLKAYSENLFSPTMAFGMLSIINWSLLSTTKMPPIFNNIIVDMALPGISAALVAYFLPQVRIKSDLAELDQMYGTDPSSIPAKPTEPNDDQAAKPIVNNNTAASEKLETEESMANDSSIRWNAGPRRLRFTSRTYAPILEQLAPVSRDPLGLYKMLELKGTETQDEIFSAYIRMAKRYHPDLHTDEYSKEQAKASFHKVLDAYNILKDENKRAEYDIKGRIR